MQIPPRIAVFLKKKGFVIKELIDKNTIRNPNANFNVKRIKI